MFLWVALLDVAQARKSESRFINMDEGLSDEEQTGPKKNYSPTEKQSFNNNNSNS
jgi:hypothetical protein